jgi:hypothetical protein
MGRAGDGSKHHVLTAGRASFSRPVSLIGGNRSDSTAAASAGQGSGLWPASSAPPTPTRRAPGRPGYDHDKDRRQLRARGIRPVIAERGQPHGSGLGIFRYVVERTIAGLHGFHRLLRIRWERRDDIHQAFIGVIAPCRAAPS